MTSPANYGKIQRAKTPICECTCWSSCMYVYVEIRNEPSYLNVFYLRQLSALNLETMYHLPPLPPLPAESETSVLLV